jgi:ribonuclease D
MIPTTPAAPPGGAFEPPTPPGGAFVFIQDDAALAGLVARLRADGITRVGIDVEGENNLHSYGIHVALIQLFDGTIGTIVDVLAIRDRTLLRKLLEDAPWTLVWFDAANDLLSFRHALGIRPSPIQDLAIAARLLGKQGGLHAMTGQPGSPSAKDRFQRANWLRRPLPPELLDYAISDVMHLLSLADDLEAQLRQKGLREEYERRNRAAQEEERTWDPFANYVRIPGFNRLPRERQHFARVLWYARELYGQRHDLPPGNVASKEELRTIIDRDFRDAPAIAGFLNNGRKRNLVDSSDLADMLAEARAMAAIDAGPSPAPIERRPPSGSGSRRGGRRRRGGRSGGRAGGPRRNP